MSSSPDALRAMIREIVREVVREMIAEEVAAAAATPRRPGAAPGSEVTSNSATRSNSAVLIERGALTERHVRAAGDARTISIGAKVVVTPLARERARARGIEIVRMSHA